MVWLERLLNKYGINRFVSATTFKNVSALMTGTFISAVIPLLTAPIMSRLFTTSSYGVLGLYMSISGLIGVLAYSHYSQAILLVKEDADARQVVWFVIFFSGVVSLITWVVLFLLRYYTHYFDSSSIGLWLYMIPVSIFLNGVNATVLLWANRVKQYTTLASNKVIQAVFTAVVQILLGIFIKNETGLLLGLLTGQLISVSLLIRRFGRFDRFGIGAPAYHSFKPIAREYKNLLFYSTPSEFINNLINQTPIFLLQRFGGLSYVGSYNFTTRILGLPQQFLSSAIVDVFKQKASASYNQIGNCKEIFLKTLKVLGILGVLPFGILIAFAPAIFKFVFGAQWIEAGFFAQFLAVMYYFRFVVSPLSYVYTIARRFREDFMLHIFFLLLTTASFFISNLLFEDKRLMIMCYSFGYCLAYLLTLYRAFQFSKGDLIG